MTKHTPGPWSSNGSTITKSNGLRVRVMSPTAAAPEAWSDIVKTLHADARLIAAAPELLEACKEMLEAYAPHAMDTVEKFGPDALHSAVKLAQQAIKKAEGEA